VLRHIIAIALTLAAGATAHADEFPSRTVTIVSPYQAGGDLTIFFVPANERLLHCEIRDRRHEAWSLHTRTKSFAAANRAIGPHNAGRIRKRHLLIS
jgi:hypothetical protein